MPWATWRTEHPGTLALDEDDFAFFRERPHDNFVIGIVLGEHARAYRFRDAARARVINDMVGPFPVLIYTDPVSRRVQTLLRQVRDRVLTFALERELVKDAQTGSIWDPVRGISTSGPLRGQVLRLIPHTSSFDWAWRDFHPSTTFYAP